MVMIQLRPYQQDGIRFLKDRNAALLYDEVGLGKTVQALSAVEQTRCLDILVICPKSAVRTWMEEIHKWTGYAAEDIVWLHAGAQTLPRARVVITHYPVLGKLGGYKVLNRKGKPEWKVGGIIHSRVWGAVIVDEAHRLKNRRSQQSRAVRHLKAQRRYALTGTPVKNRPDDLWAILNFLEPRQWSSYWRFLKEHVNVWEPPWGGRQIIGWTKRPNINHLALGRSRDDVLPELPHFTHQKIEVELSATEKKAYKQLKEELIAMLEDGSIVKAANALVLLTRLRQVTSSLATVSGLETSTKVDAVLDLIQDMDRPPLIFTAYRETAKLLHSRISGSGLLIGGMHEREAATVRHDFQNGKLEALVATFGTGGEAITLTRADTIIMLEKPWTPSEIDQAEGRIRRLSQTADTLFSYTIEAIGTVDAKVNAMVEAKRLHGLQTMTVAEFKGLL
jgi:SNF2 family DNA or RNA helicase